MQITVPVALVCFLAIVSATPRPDSGANQGAPTLRCTPPGKVNADFLNQPQRPVAPSSYGQELEKLRRLQQQRGTTASQPHPVAAGSPQKSEALAELSKIRQQRGQRPIAIHGDQEPAQRSVPPSHPPMVRAHTAALRSALGSQIGRTLHRGGSSLRPWEHPQASEALTPAQEPVQESVQEPVQESVQESVQEPAPVPMEVLYAPSASTTSEFASAPSPHQPSEFHVGVEDLSNRSAMRRYRQRRHASSPPPSTSVIPGTRKRRRSFEAAPREAAAVSYSQKPASQPLKRTEGAAAAKPPRLTHAVRERPVPTGRRQPSKRPSAWSAKRRRIDE